MESAWPPHRQVCGMQFLFQIGDALDSEMKNRSSERSIGRSVTEDIDEVSGRSRAAGCDHRNRDRSGDESYEFTIESGPRSVAIHGSEENLASSSRSGFLCPLDGVAPGGDASTGGEDLECTIG